MHTPPRQRREPQACITLVELLVAMIIMGVVSTMLVGGWISLQRSFAFAAADNKARATARDALDRVSSELRAAQPETTATATPFYLAGTSPYVCDANGCVFYSAYNNPLAASQSGEFGIGQVRLTAIYLDTTVAGDQKNLVWRRDTSGDGALTTADRTVILARNVVNGVYTGSKVSVPIFLYNVRDTSGNYTQVNSLTSANVATLVSVQVEIINDANLYHTPRYIDLRTTVQPRNQSTN